MIREREASIREARFGIAGSGKKNVRAVRALKKEIARIKTILNEVSL